MRLTNIISDAPRFNTGSPIELSALLIELGDAPPVPPSTPSFDPAYPKQLGTMDGLPVWASHCFGPDIVAIGFLDDTNIPAYIAMSTTRVRDGYPLIRIEALAGAKPGMIQALLQFCLRKMKWKLIITKDEPLTQHGWNFLIRSVERGIIIATDTTTMQRVSPSNLKQAQFDHANDLELFLEGVQLKYEHFVHNQPGMLSEVVYYIGDKNL